MPWILLLIAMLFCAPLQAVTISGVTTSATTGPPAASEPDATQTKAAYAALADVLENDASRQELIKQLRTAAATPPQEKFPTLTPPPVTEEKIVLETVTNVSRHYGEALSTRFAQLWRNISTVPHNSFNAQTFSNAVAHFLLLAVLVFAFYVLLRRSGMSGGGIRLTRPTDHVGRVHLKRCRLFA